MCKIFIKKSGKANALGKFSMIFFNRIIIFCYSFMDMYSYGHLILTAKFFQPKFSVFIINWVLTDYHLSPVLCTLELTTDIK